MSPKVIGSVMQPELWRLALKMATEATANEMPIPSSKEWKGEEIIVELRVKRMCSVDASYRRMLTEQEIFHGVVTANSEAHFADLNDQMILRAALEYRCDDVAEMVRTGHAA